MFSGEAGARNSGQVWAGSGLCEVTTLSCDFSFLFSWRGEGGFILWLPSELRPPEENKMRAKLIMCRDSKALTERKDQKRVKGA